MTTKYYLGFIGSGASRESNTVELLTDFVKPADEVELIFPLVEGSEGFDSQVVLEWSAPEDGDPLSLSVTTTRAIKQSEKFKELLDDEDVQVELKSDPYEYVVEAVVANRIFTSENSYLIVFPDDKTTPYVESALAKDIKVLDISAGLDEIRVSKEEDAKPLVEEDETLAEEKPKKRGRPRKVAESEVKDSIPEPSEPDNVPSNVSNEESTAADETVELGTGPFLNKYAVYQEISDTHLKLAKLYEELAHG